MVSRPLKILRPISRKVWPSRYWLRPRFFLYWTGRMVGKLVELLLQIYRRAQSWETKFGEQNLKNVSHCIGLKRTSWACQKVLILFWRSTWFMRFQSERLFTEIKSILKQTASLGSRAPIHTSKRAFDGQSKKHSKQGSSSLIGQGYFL